MENQEEEKEIAKTKAKEIGEQWREKFLLPILAPIEVDEKLPPNTITTRQEFALIIGVNQGRITEAEGFLDDKKTKTPKNWLKLIENLSECSEKAVASQDISLEKGRWIAKNKITKPTPKSHPAQHFYDTLPEEEIVEAFKRNKSNNENTIKILDTWVPSFILKDIDSNLNERLKDWAEKGICFEILVLNPNGTALQLRAKSIGEEWPHLRRRSIERLENLLKLQEKHPNNIALRLYDEAPSLNLFITPDDIYFGSYFSFASSADTSFQRIDNDTSKMAAHLKKHFDSIWEDEERAEPLEKSNFERIRKEIWASETISRKLRNASIQIHLPTETIPKEICQYLNFSKDFAGRNTSLGGTVELNFEMDAAVDHSNDVSWILNSSEYPTIVGKVFIIHENYFRLQFATDQKELTLNFVIQTRIEENKPTWAIYSAIHNNRAYCGIAIAQLYTDRNKSFATSEISSAMALHSRSFWYPASISGIAAEKSLIQRYKGLYYVHTYGRSNGNREDIIIVSNLLEIYESGYVEYCRTGTEVQATGHAFVCENNIYVELFTKDKRQSYFVFHAGNNPAKTGCLYTGIYAGLSQHYNNPIALRAVLEYKNENGANVNLSPLRNKIYSKGYDILPEGVRIALTGRIDNFISFSRLNGKIFSDENLQAEIKKHHEHDAFKDIYLKAAIVAIAYENKVSKGLKHLERAYKHGFANFDAFESILKGLDEYIHCSNPNFEVFQRILEDADKPTQKKRADALDANKYTIYKKVANTNKYVELKAKHEKMLREKEGDDDNVL